MALIHLYIDDSGTRRPDHEPEPRTDGMDHFALGGILVAEADIASLLGAHHALIQKWKIEKPLHSTKIRGKRGAFAWLGTDEKKAAEFMGELEHMVLSLPVVGIACVIDRPGYNARYKEKYPEPWMLCKTAFAILVERAAKFAARNESALEIYYEGAGKTEDRAIEEYAKALRSEGMPFDQGNSAGYQNLTASDFKRILNGEPNRVTKKVPMIQIADLILYPLAKSGYDRGYEPYKKLMAASRVIDAILAEGDAATLGVKYSCFDGERKTDGANSQADKK